MSDSLKDVHTEHCCLKHGCKYGRDATCTVVSGYLPQSYPCEYCHSTREAVAAWLPEATTAELVAELTTRDDFDWSMLNRERA